MSPICHIGRPADGEIGAIRYNVWGELIRPNWMLDTPRYNRNVKRTDYVHSTRIQNQNNIQLPSPLDARIVCCFKRDESANNILREHEGMDNY